MAESFEQACDIAGVQRRNLVTHADERGTLTEICRLAWSGESPPVQFNFVRSHPRTLRGVHLHRVHADYLCLVEGIMLLGLHDTRAGSPTRGQGRFLELRGEALQAVRIPVGVAHGFYFPVASILVYGLTSYWNPADELGCRFDDPALNLAWPDGDPLLSPRDRDAGSYAAMLAEYAQLDS